MKTLVKLAAIAACFIGLQASNASAEVRTGDRSDVWVVDTGGGYTEVEWTYLMLLDLGLNDDEAAMLVLGESTGDRHQKPTKVERPVFGPHFISFDD
ncbi:MAG: hypothetical protein CBD74_04025 [Saprospirales bacterium TMED214]|nr:MAG: hypothetical protein CBD74_04025 [Saprospirales bacterium TMED214]